MKPGLDECENAVIVPHIASASFWTRAGMVSLTACVLSCHASTCCHQELYVPAICRPPWLLAMLQQLSKTNQYGTKKASSPSWMALWTKSPTKIQPLFLPPASSTPRIWLATDSPPSDSGFPWPTWPLYEANFTQA